WTIDSQRRDRFGDVDLDIRVGHRSVIVYAFAHFASEPSFADVLGEQRARPILLAERAVQILEDAETRVEADQIDELERTHRVVQSELERLVDVTWRGDAFHEDVGRRVSQARVDARRDEPRRLVHQDGLLPHPHRHLLYGVDRL